MRLRRRARRVQVRKKSRTDFDQSSSRAFQGRAGMSGSAQIDDRPGIDAAAMRSVVQLPLATCRKRVVNVSPAQAW
jgi:hypothetical protein